MEDSKKEPGAVIWHSSDGESPDVGGEVIIGGGLSIYVGEVAKGTLKDCGGKIPKGATWYLALNTGSDFTPIAALTEYGQWNATRSLTLIGRAVKAAYDQGVMDGVASTTPSAIKQAEQVVSAAGALHRKALGGLAQALAVLDPAPIGEDIAYDGAWRAGWDQAMSMACSIIANMPKGGRHG